jgi:pimeloyl-ACP methyl ester carboxylesterase
MKPLILIPGALGYAQQFDPFLKELNRLKIKAYAFDLPNHGNSLINEQTNTVPLMADYFLSQLEELNIQEPVNIFGHSLGGYIGLYLCLNYPQRINQLITLGTKWLWNKDIAMKETAFLIPEKMILKIPNYVDHLKSVHTHWEVTVKTISNLMIDLGNTDYFKAESLSNIEQKVRFSIGDRDHLVTLEETIIKYQSLPNSQLQVYPNLPHSFEKVDIKQLALDFANFYD